MRLSESGVIKKFRSYCLNKARKEMGLTMEKKLIPERKMTQSSLY